MRFQTLTFPHFLTTRNDGNLAFHVGDDPENVRRNREKLAQKLGFPLEKLASAQQTHGADFQIVSAQSAGRGALDYDCAFPQTDALLTGERVVPLLILVADCAPLLIHDEQSGAFAVVHAGWRGANLGIAGEVVRAMQTHFGAQPENLKVGIGPCLQTRNLEIGEEVAEQIREKSALDFSLGEKPHLDLRLLLQLDLQNAGVAPHNIEISPLCPRENLDLFFSHRGENGKTGRFGIVAWREKNED